ncbi:MAG: hypothetical protein ACRDTE_30290 [Pseudonocardiaceae bacterium]
MLLHQPKITRNQESRIHGVGFSAPVLPATSVESSSTAPADRGLVLAKSAIDEVARTRSGVYLPTLAQTLDVRPGSDAKDLARMAGRWRPEPVILSESGPDHPRGAA